MCQPNTRKKIEFTLPVVLEIAGAGMSLLLAITFIVG